MPTGVAYGGNEIEQHRIAAKSIFREWLPVDIVWLGTTERYMQMGSDVLTNAVEQYLL